MRVAIVAAICVGREAISAAAATQAALAASLPGVERVDLFAEFIDRPLAVPGHQVRDPWDLLRHPRFRDADVAIFHWGIHCSLFDAMTLLGPDSGPRPVLMFHNMTPSALVDDERLRVTLDASAVQLAHLVSVATALWTYSEENRRALAALGVALDEIAFVPFPIQAPRPVIDRRDCDQVRLLVIGRMMRSKGTDVLVEALGLLTGTERAGLSLEIIGNPEFSYADFADGVARRIHELGLHDVVTISPDVDDEGLWQRLEAAHIVVCPSLHEGLCVPVVEAYLAGARVVAADGGNLRYIVQPPDPVVPAGDAEALANALRAVIAEVRSGADVDRSGARAVCDAYGMATTTAALQAALDQMRRRATRAVPWPSVIEGEPTERLAASR